MAIIQINITHCSERSHPKGLTLTVACNTNFVGIMKMLVLTSTQARRLALVGFVFMFGIKKEIYKQIDEYGKDRDLLRHLAKHSSVDRIQNISQERLQLFYNEHISQTPSMYFKILEVKQLNKFLRAYGVPFIMRLDEVFEVLPNSGIIESMKKVSPNDPTPKTRRNMRIVRLIDSGWSYSDVCAEYGFRSKATVFEIYHREKNRSGSSKVIHK